MLHRLEKEVQLDRNSFASQLPTIFPEEEQCQ